MIGPVKTYDPKLVLVTIGGVPITGFADGEYIKVTAHGDRYTKKVGSDGEVSRTRSNNDTHKITISLTQTSPSNSYLSQLLGLDRLANAGVRPIQITDLEGTTVLFWPEGWISKSPDIGFGKETGQRDWEFDTGQIAQEDIRGTLLPV